MMDNNILSKLYSFFIPSLAEIEFYVVKFTGKEAINRPFFFTINLLSSKADLDAEILTGTIAVFTIHYHSGKESVYTGTITKMEQGEYLYGYCRYTVEFRSFFWRTKQIITNWIYLDETIKQTLQFILNGERFYSLPYELRLTKKYPELEFSLQYNENYYDYILWRIEQLGIYFYFEQGTDKMIFADSPDSHSTSVGTVYYSPKSNLDYNQQSYLVKSFKLNQSVLPNRVIIRNYDWKQPNNIIVAEHIVSESGIGDVYYSDENVSTKEEAENIAKIRSEQLYVQNHFFSGVSAVPCLRPGTVFSLKQHHHTHFNRDYMVTEVIHSGIQTAYLNLKLQIPILNSTNQLSYKNSFKCIESNVQYRPQLTAERRKISGFIHAFIDGDENNSAFIDKYGRYKIVFPFDIQNHKEGKASCWVRRVQGQVGKDFGLAFPLVPGTEVLVSFTGGNPDLPVILGAVANGESGSITGGGNRKYSGIRSEGGAQLTFDSNTSSLNISNSAGSGMTLSSDSIDTLQTNADIGINTHSFAISQFSGIFQNSISGFRLQQMTAYDWKRIGLSFLMQGTNIASQFVSALSTQNSDPEAKGSNPWINFGLGCGQAVIGILASYLNMTFTQNDNYQALINTSENEAGSVIQCFPTAKELVANVLLVLTNHGLSFAAEDKKNKNQNKSLPEDNKEILKAYKKVLQNCMQQICKLKRIEDFKKFDDGTTQGAKECGIYYRGSETSPCAYYGVTYKAAVQSAISLQNDLDKDNPPPTEEEKERWRSQLKTLQETTAQMKILYNQACIGNLSKYQYTVNIKKKQKREMIQHALTEVLQILGVVIPFAVWRRRLHKAKRIGGVFINSDDKNINLHAKTYIGLHAERGIFLNAEKAALSEIQDWGCPNELPLNAADPGIREIFEEILPEIIIAKSNSGEPKAETIRMLLNSSHKNKKEDRLGGGLSDQSAPCPFTFIAGRSDIYYQHSSASFHVNSDRMVTIADEITLKSTNNLNRLSFSRATGNAHITFSVIAEKEILFFSGNLGEENSPADFLFSLADKQAFLGFRRDEKKDLLGFFANPNIVSLSYKDQKNFSTIALTQDGIYLTPSMKSNTALLMTEDTLSACAKKVVLSGVSFSDNKIDGAKGGVLLIGDNAVKITNMNECDNNAGKLINSIEEKIQTEIHKIEKPNNDNASVEQNEEDPNIISTSTKKRRNDIDI